MVMAKWAASERGGMKRQGSDYSNNDQTRPFFEKQNSWLLCTSLLLWKRKIGNETVGLKVKVNYSAEKLFKYMYINWINKI